MKVEIPKNTQSPNVKLYPEDDLDLARQFAKKAHREFESIVKAIILFGSTARGKQSDKKDIDILVIVDDVSIPVTSELIEAYRVIMERLIIDTSPKLHVMSLKLSTWWEYIRASDPIAINILRDGVALIDTGFFDPIQKLLYYGRIRPSKEAVYTYFARSPQTLHNSKWHLLQAVIDLYWACIDASHAALMVIGEVPPAPDHVDDLLREKLAKNGLIPKKCSQTMNKFYKLYKDITYRRITEISGKEFDSLYKEADEFVTELRRFIDSRM